MPGKPVTRFLITLCLSLPLLTACGLFGRTEPAPEHRDPVTLNLVSININAAAETALIEQYQADHPWVTMETSGLEQSPANYLSATDPPDLMGLAPSHLLASAVDAALVADLTDLWLETGIQEVYPASIQGLTEQGGKQYFLPVAYQWVAIYYNRAIFDQYNLAPPQTWDEFIAVCDVLLANGETPLALAGDSAFESTLWLDYLLLRLYGLDFHRAVSSGQVSYEDARIRTVFETWQTLLENDYFLEQTLSVDGFDAILTLVRGDEGQLGSQRAVMTLTTPYGFDQVPAVFRDELDFFRFPIMDPSVPVAEVLPTIGYIVPAGALHPLDSFEFLRFVSSAEAQATLFQTENEGVSWLPANGEAISENLSDEVQAGVNLVQGADAVTQQYLLKHPFQYFGTIDRAVQSFVRGVERGEADIPAVQAQMEEMRQQGIAESVFIEQ